MVYYVSRNWQIFIKKKMENVQFQVFIYIYNYDRNRILIREQYVLLCKKNNSRIS